MRVFLSTLSLRRATSPAAGKRTGRNHFYPRSPCGERHAPNRHPCRRNKNFYPRSPCGERQANPRQNRNQRIFLSTLSLRRATARRASRQQPAGISIHALLAESDEFLKPCRFFLCLFLSTLSLRRATKTTADCFGKTALFLSTLSLRRATLIPHQQKCRDGFLSTLSLRRATQMRGEFSDVK